MIKKFILVASAALSIAGVASAASCTSGSLNSYVALGSTGCTLGGDTLSNFNILVGFSGGAAISPASVNITISGSTYAPVLTLSTTQSAASGTPLEAIFTYDISGPYFTGISAVLSNSSETGTGGVTGLVHFCEGGTFGPDGVDGCTKPNGSLLTLDGVQNMDKSTLNLSSFLNVTDDFTLDPGSAGSATGGTLTNSFTAVPEPVTTALTAVGLLLVGAFRSKTNQRSNN